MAYEGAMGKRPRKWWRFCIYRRIREALEPPYKRGRFCMLILLPKERYGYRKLEGLLNREYLRSLLPNISQREVSVSIPKFKLSTEYTPFKVLSVIGMRDVFNEKANLSGITGAERLFISGVVHKVPTKVTENGTGAAAATGVILTASVMPLGGR